ncbi:MAG TPA: AAA family ATPase [Pilimelia sp.]|nr:AAA family ATPase [Pilimelia sp.]
MDRRDNELSPEHRALLKHLARVHLDNGAKALQSIANAMNLKSKSRVSHLLRGDGGALPVDRAQLQALVRALGGGDDEVRRGLSLYEKARKARAVSAARRKPGRAALPVRRDAEARPWAAPVSLIGRQEELDRVRIWTADLKAGRGRAVLVEGEPGIGKSSLLSAAATEAATAGCQVIWAACDELSQVFPLLPLLDALDVSAPDGGRGSRKITELFRAGSAPHSGVDVTAAAVERLLALTAELCAAAPTMLVVDDLQWADPATVMTLGRLTRSAGELPLLLIGATRPIPQRQELSALRRATEASGRLSLRNLSSAEVVEFVARAVGGTPGSRLLELAAGAAGNPLYLTELVDALVRGGATTSEDGRVEVAGGRAPDTLRAAIADRLQFLSGRVRRVLHAAALLGVDFSVSELAAVSGSPTSDLLPALEEALVVGVLRENGPELAFRHPMIHAVLYEEIPPAVRAAWHRDAGRALAEAGAAAPRVARQLLPTLDGPKESTTVDEWIVRWLCEVSQQLVGQAPDAAIPLLRAAVADVPVGRQAHDLLTCRLADALYRVGDAAGAAEVASRALPYVTQPDVLVDLHWTLTQCRASEGRSEETLVALERALNSPGIEARHRARLLVLTARTHRSLGQVDAAGQYADEALAAATAAGDRWATGWALGVLTIVHGTRGEAATTLPLFDRALAVSEGDPAMADLNLVLQINQAAALGDLDRHDEAIRIAARARRLANDAGNIVRLTQARSVLAELLFDIGRWDEALAEIDRGSGTPKDPGVECNDRGVAATIGLHRDHSAAGRQVVDAERYAARVGRRVFGSLTLARSLDRERAGAKGEALDVLLEGLSAATGHQETAVDLLADAVRLAVAVDDRTTARTLADRAESIARGSDVPHRQAVGPHCRGLLDHNPAPLLRAAHLYKAAERLLPRAQALEAAAAAAADNGDLTGARTHLAEAISAYIALGAEWDLSRIRSHPPFSPIGSWPGYTGSPE